MDRLIKSIIGIVIAVIVLYLIMGIFAIIIIVIAGAIKKYIDYRDSKIEWTEWEWERDTVPIISRLPSGERVFQSQSNWKRYNRFTKTWDTKVVTDPIQRPLSEATKLADLSEIMCRSRC